MSFLIALLLSLSKLTISSLPSNIEAMLLVELDGEITSIKRQAEMVVDLARKLKGEVQVATDYYARENLWKARRKYIDPVIIKNEG